MKETDPEVLKVALVSPGPAMRAGLRSMLQPETDLYILVEAASVQELKGLLHQIDIVLISAWGANPPQIPAAIFESFPELPVLFLTNTPLTIQDLGRISSRNWGAISMESSSEEIMAAMNALHNGLWVASPGLIQSLLKRDFAQPDQEDNLFDRLTGRETEVLQLIAQGLTNRQIAAKLHLSEHTIKYHVSSIYSKLNAANRTEATREGIRLGLIIL